MACCKNNVGLHALVPNNGFEFNQFDSCGIQSHDTELEHLELCKQDQVWNNCLRGQSNSVSA